MRTCTLIVVSMVVIAMPAIANEQEAATLRQQAQVAYQARNYQDAAELFERSDILYPRLETAYNAGVCYLHAGLCDAARQPIHRLIDRTAELRDNASVGRAVAALLGQQDTPEGGRCALVNRLLRSVDEALGIELETDVSESDARSFADQARRYYETGDFARAAVLYDSAHSTYPMLVDALFNAGMAYHLAGRQAEALGAFRRVVEQSSEAVRSDPEVARAISEAAAPGDRTDAQLCELASRLRRSIAAASGEQATALAASERLFRRGVAVGNAGDLQEAVVFFDCSNLVTPNRSSRLNAAIARVNLHQWVEALRAFDAYLSEVPDVAADPTVQRARQAIEAEPYANDEHATELFRRLRWAIDRAED